MKDLAKYFDSPNVSTKSITITIEIPYDVDEDVVCEEICNFIDNNYPINRKIRKFKELCKSHRTYSSLPDSPNNDYRIDEETGEFYFTGRAAAEPWF